MKKDRKGDDLRFGCGVELCAWYEGTPSFCGATLRELELRQGVRRAGWSPPPSGWSPKGHARSRKINFLDRPVPGLPPRPCVLLKNLVYRTTRRIATRAWTRRRPRMHQQRGVQMPKLSRCRAAHTRRLYWRSRWPYRAPPAVWLRPLGLYPFDRRP